MIAESLAGTRIAVTGATGFLGTAVVERLLRCVPDCDVVVVIRPGRDGATERARRDIFANDCFDRLRAEVGPSWESWWQRRVTVVSGDVAVDGLGLDERGRAELSRCDVFIHSAADVTFDAPLDRAAEVNLRGPSRVVELLNELGSRAHLISVSTAYVGAGHRGPVPEATLPDTPRAPWADWRAELAAARGLRPELEAAGRVPRLARRFAKSARRELGRASAEAVAERAEQLRTAWVEERAVAAGRARATALGWPDVYAYTKGLAEYALLDRRGERPVTIVRPSIVESAFAEPTPGWIRGFRVVDPLIIGYAKGRLSKFPGSPEHVLDVIPVDLVAAALIAVAAKGPDPSGPVVYHVASGSRNPLNYRELVDLTVEYFRTHPLTGADGTPVIPADWRFVRRSRLERRLRITQLGLDLAARALARVPRAALSRAVAKRRTRISRARAYLALYGAYAECQARFQTERLLGLIPSQDTADGWSVDPALIDWPTYLQKIHLPGIVDGLRAAREGRSS